MQKHPSSKGGTKIIYGKPWKCDVWVSSPLLLHPLINVWPVFKIRGVGSRAGRCRKTSHQSVWHIMLFMNLYFWLILQLFHFQNRCSIFMRIVIETFALQLVFLTQLYIEKEIFAFFIHHLWSIRDRCWQFRFPNDHFL